MRYRLSDAAVSDIADALLWSEDNFGPAAALRYEALMDAAVEDVTENPLRLGSTEHAEIGPGIRTWHLRQSQYASGDRVVKRPRHFLLYRVEDPDVVAIGRVLHDRMLIERNLDVERDFS